MIRTIGFNALATGETVADQFADIGVTISAVANGSGADQAMIFDSNNPTGGDDGLATDNLDNVLVISQDGDASAPNDNAMGGVFTFEFEEGLAIKSLTSLDLEVPARLTVFAEDGTVLSEQFVPAIGDNEQNVVQLFVPVTARFEVALEGSGAIDNLVFDDDSEDVVDPIDPVDPVDPTPSTGEFLNDDGSVSGSMTFAEIENLILPDLVGNTDPLAVDDTAETDEDTAVTIDVLGNDSDPEGDTLEVTVATSPDGTVVINDDGTLEFTPNADFNGDAVIN